MNADSYLEIAGPGYAADLLSVPGHPTLSDSSRATVIAVGAGGDCLYIFICFYCLLCLFILPLVLYLVIHIGIPNSNIYISNMRNQYHQYVSCKADIINLLPVAVHKVC